MNTWIIVAIVVGLLVIGGVSLLAVTNAEEPVKGGCKICNGKCTSENNCRISGCNAVSVKSCSCGNQ